MICAQTILATTAQFAAYKLLDFEQSASKHEDLFESFTVYVKVCVRVIIGPIGQL